MNTCGGFVVDLHICSKLGECSLKLISYIYIGIGNDSIARIMYEK